MPVRPRPAPERQRSPAVVLALQREGFGVAGRHSAGQVADGDLHLAFLHDADLFLGMGVSGEPAAWRERDEVERHVLGEDGTEEQALGDLVARVVVHVDDRGAGRVVVPDLGEFEVGALVGLVR